MSKLYRYAGIAASIILIAFGVGSRPQRARPGSGRRA